MGPPAEMSADDSDRSRDEADARQLARYASELATAVESAVPVWVVRCVVDRAPAVAAGLRSDAEAAADGAVADIGPQVRSLLELDVDEQRINPLALIREAVIWPTSVLRRHGVAPIRRDEEARRLFPDDDYDLTPGSWADVAPALGEPGLRWGAAKAHVMMSRRRSAGGG